MIDFIVLLIIVTSICFVTIYLISRYLFGIVLWRKCKKCGSRNTTTSKGWVLSCAFENDGFQFTEDMFCSACSTNSPPLEKDSPGVPGC
jgi:hypothetical protein